MPGLDEYEQWLIDVAQSIGWGNGETPTSFAEIEAWCRLSGVGLTILEVEAVKELSITYLSHYQQYKDANAKPPFMSDETKRAWAEKQSQNIERLLG